MTRKKKGRDDEMMVLLIQIRDELRAANARRNPPEAPQLPKKLGSAATTIAITPELDAALLLLRCSVLELEQTVKQELLENHRDRECR